MGLKMVPMARPGITTEQARLMNLALNRINGLWS
jgi:hypothetical protein